MLSVIHLAEGVPRGENIDMTVLTVNETLLKVLEVQLSFIDIKSVELSIVLPPMRGELWIKLYGWRSVNTTSIVKPSKCIEGGTSQTT